MSIIAEIKTLRAIRDYSDIDVEDEKKSKCRHEHHMKKKPFGCNGR